MDIYRACICGISELSVYWYIWNVYGFMLNPRLYKQSTSKFQMIGFINSGSFQKPIIPKPKYSSTYCYDIMLANPWNYFMNKSKATSVLKVEYLFPQQTPK